MVKSSCPGKLGRRVRAMVKLLPGRMDRKVRVMVKFLSRQPRPADRVNQEGRGQFNFTIKRPQNFQKIRKYVSYLFAMTMSLKISEDLKPKNKRSLFSGKCVFHQFVVDAEYCSIKILQLENHGKIRFNFAKL